ncbi:hypothetical protein BD289DRAFT_429175 [Coniella lustricola]|uniref:Uncharacterized protein n=1 Tax=Coniella lustricola TaxID=2025994 RepID=A0A2T3ADB9_9PEZI|nr:hypothetical protein BD289DRAFT_429175 [Coniella lustricola]
MGLRLADSEARSWLGPPPCYARSQPPARRTSAPCTTLQRTLELRALPPPAILGQTIAKGVVPSLAGAGSQDGIMSAVHDFSSDRPSPAEEDQDCTTPDLQLSPACPRPDGRLSCWSPPRCKTTLSAVCTLMASSGVTTAESPRSFCLLLTWAPQPRPVVVLSPCLAAD